ncbi:hypothetical protein HID58_072413, partial [Brassica napus]
IPVSLSTAPHSGNQNPPHPWLTTTSSSKPLFIHLPEKRSRVATKASLSRTNEASLSAIISMLERERQGLTDSGGEQWHTAEDFCRRDKKTEEERRLRDTWRKIQGEDDWAGLTDPMDPVLRSELIRYGEMAQACYDTFDFDPSSRYCGNPCRVLASKCITSPFRSDVGCWFDEALRTQAVLLEAGFLNIFERCLYGPGELETEVSGSSSRFVVGFLCTELLLFLCSPVRRAVVLMNSGGLEKLSNGTESISRSNAATGLCTPHGNYGRKDEPIDKIKHWALQLAQRHRMQLKQRKESDRPLYQVGKPILIDVEQIAPGTVLGTTHTYVIKTGTQDKPGAKRASLPSLLLFDKFHYIYVESRIGSHWCLHPSGVEKNQNLLQLQLVILELGLNSFI